MPPSNSDSWVPRTDAGARKLIDRVDAIASKLDARIQATDEDLADLRKSINRRFKHKVGWFGIISLLTLVGAAVIGFAVSSANATRREMMEARQQLADDVRQVRAETAARLNTFEAKQDAMLQVTVEGKSRRDALKELERRTADDPGKKDKP